ncbi:hypothetical protein EYF80_036025 [Liparis tanakae]|uniref:Uncharacterized protein n=1 Tax=Liparis tanakae TaxID=230148 RepID=A0A4Z2GJN1_9TELE|nr:hypothetical protein EYF80_036025 [Liparis tanakae]
MWRTTEAETGTKRTPSIEVYFKDSEATSLTYRGLIKCQMIRFHGIRSEWGRLPAPSSDGLTRVLVAVGQPATGLGERGGPIARYCLGGEFPLHLEQSSFRWKIGSGTQLPTPSFSPPASLNPAVIVSP